MRGGFVSVSLLRWNGGWEWSGCLRLGRGAELTIWIARGSSSSESADPPQQLRERKKELILDVKEGGWWWWWVICPSMMAVVVLGEKSRRTPYAFREDAMLFFFFLSAPLASRAVCLRRLYAETMSSIDKQSSGES